MAQHNIKFYPKLYLGLREQPIYENGIVISTNPPLGFLTPAGSDKAAKKRMDSVDGWVHQYNWVWDPVTRTQIQKPSIPTETIDNLVLSGFKIAKMVRRYETSNVVWRIVDPRGFELEIASQCLAYIIEDVGIGAGGIIEVPCVWGRLGPKNWLVPQNSEYWKELGL